MKWRSDIDLDESADKVNTHARVRALCLAIHLISSQHSLFIVVVVATASATIFLFRIVFLVYVSMYHVLNHHDPIGIMAMNYFRS